LANQTNQLHDFNPGFGAPVNAPGDRVFWIAAVPEDSIRKDNPGAGKAELRVNNLAIRDFGNIGNALAQGSSVAATVSFDVVWTGHPTRHVNVADAAHGFAGTYVETQATVTWSARENGFTFTSNAASTSTSLFAETGHERNGTFFS
jgi:hypothetical protein